MFIRTTGVALASLVAILTATVANSGSLIGPDRLANIKDTLLLPAAAKTNAALKLAVEDPKQACNEAGAAEGLMNQASLEARQLLQEMAAAKTDDQSTHYFVDNIDANAKRARQLRDEVCSGRLAQTETSPATQKFARLLGTPMKAYTDAVMEANAAANRGDESGMCLALKKGQTVLTTLRTNLATLRETAEADGSGEGLTLFETRLTGFESSMAQNLKACPN